MPSFKCKRCQQKNIIPKIWLDIGINRIVSCSSCDHKMRLNLKPNNDSDKLEKGAKILFEVQQNTDQSVLIALNTKNPHRRVFFGQNPLSNPFIAPNDNINLVKIDDEYVSETHCHIDSYFTDNGLKIFLEDSGSLNGTFINAIRLQNKTTLQCGDSFKIGNHTIKIRCKF